MKRLKGMGAALFVALCAAAVLLLPTDTAQGISEGIALCVERIIPSVFPMMLVCVMAVECGLASKAGKQLAPLSERMFRLPGEGAAAVLLSIIGGYPAGAKTVVELYERGAVTRAQAARMALFCFCSGPAFLIGIVGGLTGSPAAGWLLMTVQAAVVGMMGVMVGAVGGRRGERVESACAAATKREDTVSVTGAIVTSVSKSASAVMQVCLYVIIFSAVNTIAARSGISAAVEAMLVRLGADERVSGALLPSLLEVTGGCVRSADAGLPMIAFAVGFGGLSVHLQVLAITEKLGVNRFCFFAARIMQGLLSAGLTAGVLALLPEGAVLPASASLTRPEISSSPQGAVVLVVMCAMCVLCMPQDRGSAGRSA